MLPTVRSKRKDDHTENLGGTHYLGETDPHKKPSVPLTHWGDFAIKHDEQCQPKHHGEEF